MSKFDKRRILDRAYENAPTTQHAQVFAGAPDESGLFVLDLFRHAFRPSSGFDFCRPVTADVLAHTTPSAPRVTTRPRWASRAWRSGAHRRSATSRKTERRISKSTVCDIDRAGSLTNAATSETGTV